MKKTLLFLPALALSVLPLIAQHSGDYQFQFQFKNNLSEWKQAPDGSWYGAGWSTSYPGYPMGVPFVIRWDARNDSVYWTRNVPMPLAEDVWDVALLPAADGGVYVGAVFDGCDYGTPDGLAKLSAAGDILWTKTTPQSTGWSSKLWLLPYPNGHLLYQTDHYQIEFDADGVEKWTDKTPFNWNGMALRQDGGYLVYGNQKFGKTNLFLSIIEQPFPEQVYHARQLPSGNWLFLGDQHIYRLSEDFSILEEKLLTGTKSWSNIFETGGVYWINGENTLGMSELKRIDTTTLGVLDIYPFDQNYRLTALLYQPGDSLLWLSGDENFERNQTVFLKSTPLINPVIAPTRSLALTDIRLETTPKVFADNCSGWNAGSDFEIRFGKVYVTVKNTGAAPVQKFSVNGHFNRCSFICTGYEQIVQPFYLTLLPGESQEVLLLSNFDLDGQYNTSAFDLCFWTAVPDDRIDAIPDDDRFCKTFSVLVSEEEPALTSHNIRVSPNPATDYMTFVVESSNPAADGYSISLTNLSGQVVLQEHFTGPGFQLTRDALPAGIYFYEIEQRHLRLGTGKVVFME